MRLEATQRDLLDRIPKTQVVGSIPAGGAHYTQPADPCASDTLANSLDTRR